MNSEVRYFPLMKWLICLILVALSGISFAAPSQNPPIRVLTFNILAPCWADPTIYPPAAGPYLDRESRRAKIISFLKNHPEVDIFLLQEVTQIEFGYINSALSSSYQGFQSLHSPNYWSQYITENPPWEPNGNAIFLKKSRFKNVVFNDVPLSNDGNHGALATAVDKSTSKTVRAISVHLDSDYPYNREAELSAAIDRMPGTANIVDIIGGDFNIDISKTSLQNNITTANFINSLLTLNIDEVTSPYLEAYYKNSVFGPIDNVLVRNGTPIDAMVYDFGLFELYPNKNDEAARIIANLQVSGSDHFPVGATLNVNSQ